MNIIVTPTSLLWSLFLGATLSLKFPVVSCTYIHVNMGMYWLTYRRRGSSAAVQGNISEAVYYTARGQMCSNVHSF